MYELKNVGGGWLLNPLYTFYPNNQADGCNLYSKVVIGPDGALYGSAELGGVEGCDNNNNMGCGTIFKLQPHSTFCASFLCEWDISVLYYFSPDSGSFPDQIVFGPDGNIYGTTDQGGNLGGNCPPYGCGAVFQLTNSGGTWTQNILYKFSGPDGSDPIGGVIVDSAGNLYGTTWYGGSNNLGIVYKLSPSQGSWTQTILHDFNGADGANPVGPLTLDASGNLYGTNNGGTIQVATVFSLSSLGAGNFQTLYTFYGSREPQGGLLLDSSGNIYGALYLGGAYHAGSIYKLTQANGTWSYTDLYDFDGYNSGQFPNGGLIMDAQGNLYGTCGTGGGSQDDAKGTAWEFTP